MIRGILSIAIVLLQAAHVPAQEVSPLLTVTSRIAGAKLSTATEAGELTFVVEDKKVQVPRGKLVYWGSPVEPQRGPIVVTSGGSRIVAADPSVLGGVVTLKAEQFHIEHDTLGEIRLPQRYIRSIIFELPGGREQYDALLRRHLPADGADALVLLTNGDELRGTLLELDEDGVTFRSNVGEVALPLTELTAVYFKPLVRATQSEEPKLLVGLDDGSLLSADALEYSANRLQVTLSERVRLDTADAAPVFLQSMRGGFVYLSDLKPAAFRHVPFLTSAWPYHADANVRGGQLRAGGRFYPKGLGLHSAAQLTYVVPQGFERFEADIALDDSAGDRGSVVFRVYLLVDGKWRQEFASDVVRGPTLPTSVSVPLVGAKALTLMVDFADRGDELDHADWLNARIVR
ncbi:MAG: NPCBM/NEW2 domain-containing protein [Planctomycetales bacterium]|nr:NPCBM/NEW2 domain-containing protein [Planctomycetales bacterium]